MLTRCSASRRSRSYRVQRLPGRSLQPIITGALILGSGTQHGFADLRDRQEATQKHCPPLLLPHLLHFKGLHLQPLPTPTPVFCIDPEDKGLNINSLKSETTDIPCLSSLGLDTGEPMTVQIKETASLSLSHSFPLIPFSALRQKYYCFHVPARGVLGIDVCASGKARNGFLVVPSLQNETCMAQNETRRLAELAEMEEFLYIRKYRQFS